MTKVENRYKAFKKLKVLFNTIVKPEYKMKDIDDFIEYIMSYAEGEKGNRSMIIHPGLVQEHYSNILDLTSVEKYLNISKD